MEYEIENRKDDTLKITREDFEDLRRQFNDKDCCAAIITIKIKKNSNKPKRYKETNKPIKVE